MSKSDIWYGFLQAGENSSPVVRDATLETKSPKTVFLYNYVRGKILEYSREIVEPKLRELAPGDVPLKELQSAFKAARKTFASSNAAKKWEDAGPAAPAARVTNVIPEDDLPLEDFTEEV
jgi:hypothetical protein